MSSRAPGKSPAARSCWMVGCVRHTACTKRSFACSAAVLARCRTSRGKLSDFSTRLTSSARMRKRSASICDRPKATCWLRWSYDSSASKKPSDLVDTSLSSVSSTCGWQGAGEETQPHLVQPLSEPLEHHHRCVRLLWWREKGEGVGLRQVEVVAEADLRYPRQAWRVLGRGRGAAIAVAAASDGPVRCEVAVRIAHTLEIAPKIRERHLELRLRRFGRECGGGGDDETAQVLNRPLVNVLRQPAQVRATPQEATREAGSVRFLGAHPKYSSQPDRGLLATPVR
eukprot:scaffold80477_cov71-Phaeocystis_antarctica.AAC.5